MRLAIALAVGLSLAGSVCAYELDADPFWKRIESMMPPGDVATMRQQIERLPEPSRGAQLRVSVWQALGRSELGSAIVLEHQLMLDTVAGYKFVGAPCEGLEGFNLMSLGEGPQSFKAAFLLSAFMDNLLFAEPLDVDPDEAEPASIILRAGADRFRLKTIPDEAGSACFIEKMEN